MTLGAPRLLVGAPVDRSRVHRAGLEQALTGCVVARPPDEAGRRPVTFEWPGQQGEGRIATGDRQGRPGAGNGLDLDERAGWGALRCGRMSERRVESPERTRSRPTRGNATGEPSICESKQAGRFPRRSGEARLERRELGRGTEEILDTCAECSRERKSYLERRRPPALTRCLRSTGA